MNWVDEAEVLAEERAQYNEWLDDNLEDLAYEYVEDEALDKDNLFIKWERLVSDPDSSFLEWCESKWADTDRRIGEE
jgi:hypothetical protein